MTVREVLAESGLDAHEAERLLMSVMGLNRSELLSVEVVPDPDRGRFRELAAQRRNGFPLQYLEGTVPFGAIDVMVDQRALIPRPETEYLWELASKRPGAGVVVDLGTGTGVLALSAKQQWPGAAVYGTDLSPEALALASENAQRLELDIVWSEGDLFDALDSTVRGTIDLVMTNPPYVAEDEFDSLPFDVRVHEPRGALVAADEGLAVIRRIGAEVGSWLAPGGEVWCEIGESQGPRAVAAFAALDARVVLDLAGRVRFVHGVKR